MAVEETLGSTDIIKSPNNILAVEYLKAIKKLNSALEPVTISRCGAGHDQMEENGGVSASFLREKMKKGEDILQNMFRRRYTK